MAPRKPLSPFAQEKWEDLAASVDEAQHDLLAVYCEAYADWTDASEKIKGGGRLIRIDGRVSVSPWVTIRDNAADTIERVGAALGITMRGAILEPEREDDVEVDPETIERAKKALRASGGVVKDAAKMLGTSRQTFHRKFAGLPEIIAFRAELKEEVVDIAETHAYRMMKAGDKNFVLQFLRWFGRDRGYDSGNTSFGDSPGGGEGGITIRAFGGFMNLPKKTDGE